MPSNPNLDRYEYTINYTGQVNVHESIMYPDPHLPDNHELEDIWHVNRDLHKYEAAATGEVYAESDSHAKEKAKRREEDESNLNPSWIDSIAVR